MKKAFISILLLSSLSHASTVCFEDGVTRCIQSDKSAFENVFELIIYGDSTGAVYTLSANKRQDSVTIRFKNGKDFLNTVNNMDEQGIALPARATVLNRLYK
jgi:hypothetical protein